MKFSSGMLHRYYANEKIPLEKCYKEDEGMYCYASPEDIKNNSGARVCYVSKDKLQELINDSEYPDFVSFARNLVPDVNGLYYIADYSSPVTAKKTIANDGYGDFKSEWKDSDDTPNENSMDNQEPEVSKDSMVSWLENTGDFYNFVMKNCSGWQGVEAFISTSPKVKSLLDSLRKKFEQEIKEYHELDSLTISPEEFTDAAKEAALGFYKDVMPTSINPNEVLDSAPSVNELNKLFKFNWSQK